MAKAPKESPMEETVSAEKAERKAVGKKAFMAEEKSEGDTRFKSGFSGGKTSKSKKPQYR